MSSPNTAVPRNSDEVATSAARCRRLLDCRQRFYVVSLLLIVLGCGVHFNDLRNRGFGTHDERGLAVDAWAIKNGGVTAFISCGYAISVEQGRVGYLWALWPAFQIYLLDAALRPAYIAAIQIGSYASIALFLSFFLGRPAALLAFASFLCFGTHTGHHYPDIANPILFHLGVGLFFFGCTLQLWRRRFPAGWQRSGLAVAIFLAVFWSMGTYEAQDVGCVIVETAILCWIARDFRRTGESRPILRAFRDQVPIISAVAGYFAAYAIWRLIHPSAYSGNQIGGPQQLGRILHAWAVYTISPLPGANLFYGVGASLLRGELSQGVSLARFWWSHFGWTECILGAAIAATVWMYVSYRSVMWGNGAGSGAGLATEETHSRSFSARALTLLVVAGLVALVTQVPLALVPKYNQNLAWAPHVPSFYAFLCFCVAIPAGLSAIGARLGRFRIATGTMCAFAAFVLYASSREVSAMVVSSQSRDYAPTKLVETFLKSKLFAALPDQATIVAPSLWESPTMVLPLDSAYWQDFINLQTGKHLHVTSTLPDVSVIIPQAKGSMYYMEQQTFADDGAILLLSPLHVSAEGTILSSDSLSVISNQPLAGKVVEFVLSSEYDSRPAGINSGLLQNAALGGEYDGHLFAATVAIPDGFIPGSAFVISSGAGALKQAGLHEQPYEPMRYGLAGKVRIDFGKGFWGVERNGGEYWHWSDGVSGTGEVSLWNETARPVDVVFDACIKTGHAAPSRLEFGLNAKKEISSANNVCTPISRKWTLEPGENLLSIHSDAPRYPTQPTDPRNIVFGVFDWKLHEPGVPALSQETVQEKVRLEFGQGFSGLETSGPNTASIRLGVVKDGRNAWHWSDGASGTAELLFWNQTAQTLNVIFEACIMTGQVQHSRLVATYGGRSDVFSGSSACEPIVLRMALAPGKNTVSLHSDAPRHPAADSRYLVFGVWNWTVRLAKLRPI